MILSYRGIPHANNECEILIQQKPLWSERSRRYGTTKTINIRGRLVGASVSALTTLIEDLEDAYSEDGGDLILYDSDGSTQTAHVFRSKDTMGGLRVTAAPSYPEGKGAEYSTFRHYEVTLEGDFSDFDENLLAWVETIDETGVAGAPDWMHVPVLNGDWPRQDVSERTPVQVVQRGKAIGFYQYPSRPPPLWSGSEKRKLRQFTKKLPDRVGDDLRNFEVGWAYTFESMTSLQGETSVP